MSLIWRRYVKATGYAPVWFYAVLAVAFVALTAWAITSRDWIVAALAVVMIVVAVSAVPITRRLSRGLAASDQEHRR